MAGCGCGGPKPKLSGVRARAKKRRKGRVLGSSGIEHISRARDAYEAARKIALYVNDHPCSSDAARRLAEADRQLERADVHFDSAGVQAGSVEGRSTSKLSDRARSAVDVARADSKRCPVGRSLSGTRKRRKR